MSSPFYLGIIGARKRNSQDDLELVCRVVDDYLQRHGRNLILVSGGCKLGADRMAEVIAESVGIPILIYYPEKHRIGKDFVNSTEAWKRINFDRNSEVARLPDTMLALVEDPEHDEDGGTGDTINKFRRYNAGQEVLIR